MSDIDTDTTTTDGENIAATLARVLPAAQILTSYGEENELQYAVLPQGQKLQAIDLEHMLAGPRRTKLTVPMLDADSFLEYVTGFAASFTPAVWCDFHPLQNRLQFVAVIDETTPDQRSWRGHRVLFKPAMAVEWATWIQSNGSGKMKSQVDFAEFIEANERDILAGEGLPSSTDMLKMATEFEANSEKRLKSVVKLQGGGVAIDYVNSDNEETIERMRVFSRFQLGLPVFWSIPKGLDAPVKGYPLQARLKYRQASGKVSFYYELIRPDLVYQTAALELIDLIRNVTEGAGVPFRLGLPD